MSSPICLPAATLERIPAGYLQVQWSSEPYAIEAKQEVFEVLLTLLAQSRESRVFTHQRSLNHTPDWLLVDWFPRAVATGLRYVAVVPPAALEVRLQSGYLFSEAQQRYGIRSRLFLDPQEAVEWLLTIPG